MLSTVGGTEAGNSSSSLEEPVSVIPAFSTHRLKASVTDLSSPTNSTSTDNNNDDNDDMPFLPSGLYNGIRNVQEKSNLVSEEKKNFTPSYFIGEVIPEPYVPERFQNARSNQARNDSSRSYQNPIASQTSLAFQKLLPIIDHHIQQAALPPVEDPPESSLDYHITPVHETSLEDEESTTPKYTVNFGDDQRLTGPRYKPYKFEDYNTLSTKPITFEDPLIGQVVHHYKPPNDEEHYRHEKAKGHSNNKGLPYPVYTHSQLASGFSAGIETHSKPHYDHYLLDHYQHHPQEPDLALPPTFYPPDPADIPHGHLKEVHYKVYKQLVLAIVLFVFIMVVWAYVCFPLFPL